MPKGVLWRQADIFVAALGGRRNDGAPVDELDDLVAERRGTDGGLRCCPLRRSCTAPATGCAFTRLHRRRHGRHPEPARPARPRRRLVASSSASGRHPPHRRRRVRASAARRARPSDLRPVLAALVLLSGGAPLSAPREAGVPRRSCRRSSSSTASARPRPARADAALSAARRRVDGHVHAVGRPPRARRRGPHRACSAPATTRSAGSPSGPASPLGYLGDAEKTARTFPVDRRRALRGAGRPGALRADGDRSSCTAATRSRSTPAARRSSPRRSSRRSATTPPSTTSSSSAGPSERWGQEVVAVVQLRDGVATSTDEPSCSSECEPAHRPLQAAQGVRASSTRSCAARAGKADYRWARTTAAG